MSWQEFSQQAQKPVAQLNTRQQAVQAVPLHSVCQRLASTMIDEIIQTADINHLNDPKRPSLPYNPHRTMTDLVTFCRHHQFRPALCLFVHLLGQVNYHPPSSSEYQSFLAALDNDQRKATLVQKSVSTMVRYAPNARTSFAFALFALKDLGCVRDENLDNTLLINLIYVCKLEHTPLAMDQALKLVKDGVKRGLTKPRVVDAKDKLNEKYREPHTAFISVSRSVASYFHMEIDCQNHALVSQRPR